ncbi:MAG: UDP-N-acetylmuramoyl-tripeptide--D-alanyl-D-alanine ligase [Actinomycetota bacterium]
MRITASAVAGCTGGRVAGGDAEAGGLSFDTRTLVRGEAFVALTAERDGHDFIPAAAAAGAAFAIVARGRSVDGIVCVEVDDTLEALAAVGRMCRDRLEGVPVVGITGSAGKTSTKDFVLSVLRAGLGTVHGAHKSFNNDVGVPVTLASTPDGARAVVVEMGMRGHGEITRLCSVARPTVGIVTVVGDAHSDRVGGIDGVARAKAELPASLPADGTAVLNGDDARVAAMSGATRAGVITYGTSMHNDVRVVTVSVDGEGHHTVDISHAGRTATVRVGAPGAHMAMNACAAVAAGIVLGVDLGTAVAAVGDVELAGQRMQWRSAPSGMRVLDDTYNANSASMEAALRTLAAVDAGERFAVLGAMAELDDPAAAHRAVAGSADALGIILLPLETDLYGIPAVSLDDVAARLAGRGPSTAVLVKGSRSSRTERAVDVIVGPQ